MLMISNQNDWDKREVYDDSIDVQYDPLLSLDLDFTPCMSLTCTTKLQITFIIIK